MVESTLRADDRGTSTVLAYVLALGVTAILIGGLIVGGSGFVDTQRENIAETELQIAGQQLASNIESADRLTADDISELSISRSLRRNVATGSYQISIEERPESNQSYELVLQTSAPSVTVSVRFRSETPVRTGTVNGGDVLITYDTAAEEVVISSA